MGVVRLSIFFLLYARPLILHHGNYCRHHRGLPFPNADIGFEDDFARGFRCQPIAGRGPSLFSVSLSGLFFLLRDDEGAWPKVGRGGSIVHGAECVRGFWDERRMNVK